MHSSSEARFRQAPKDQRDVVRLHFLRTTNKESFYAPGIILKLWSGVLRNALEDTPSATASVQQEQANPEYEDAITSIPMDDTDTAAWEDALRLMYPSAPLFQVNFDNASRLLLLADKYDMPCITEHVKLFVTGQEGDTSRLQQHLTAGNVFEWLRVTSRVGLAESAKQCITYIISQSLPLPQGYISSVQLDVLQQLFNAQQEQAKANNVTISGLILEMCAATQQRSQLESELTHLRVKFSNLSDAADYTRGMNCGQCGYVLFRKPNGKQARNGGIFCLNCGTRNNS